MSSNKVLVMGDSNIDLIVKGMGEMPRMGQEAFVDKIEMHVGGSAANVAISLAKLDVPVALHSFQGEDIFAGQIHDLFTKVGLDDSYLYPQKDASTGITIAVSDQTDRFFISDMGANKYYTPLQFPPEQYQNFCHVHFSLYHINLLSAYKKAAEYARRANCTISLDLGWTEFDSQRAELFDLLNNIDVFFPNLHEATYLCGQAPVEDLAGQLAEHVRGPVVITMGKEGACCLHLGEFYRNGFQVDAKDAVGTGDAFDAGFIKEYIKGSTADKCLLHGCACGAITVSGTGGGESSPTTTQLAAFLKNKAE